MFKNINVYRLRNSEFLEFIRNIIRTCDGNSTDQLHLGKQVDSLKDYLQKLDKVFLTERKNEHTQSLIELDRGRDEALLGIRGTLVGATYHPEPQVRESSARLLDKMDSYGDNIPRLNNEAETTVVINLLEDLESDKFKAYVGTVGIGFWLKHLKERNQAFQAEYRRRVEFTAGESRIAVTEVRPEASTAYRTLLEHISARHLVTPSPAYEKLIAEINVLIDRFNTIISSRRNRVDDGDGGNNGDDNGGDAGNDGDNGDNGGSDDDNSGGSGDSPDSGDAS